MGDLRLVGMSLDVSCGSGKRTREYIFSDGPIRCGDTRTIVMEDVDADGVIDSIKCPNILDITSDYGGKSEYESPNKEDFDRLVRLGEPAISAALRGLPQQLKLVLSATDWKRGGFFQENPYNKRETIGRVILGTDKYIGMGRFGLDVWESTLLEDTDADGRADRLSFTVHGAGDPLVEGCQVYVEDRAYLTAFDILFHQKFPMCSTRKSAWCPNENVRVKDQVIMPEPPQRGGSEDNPDYWISD